MLCYLQITDRHIGYVPDCSLNSQGVMLEWLLWEAHCQAVSVQRRGSRSRLWAWLSPQCTALTLELGTICGRPDGPLFQATRASLLWAQRVYEHALTVLSRAHAHWRFVQCLWGL